MAPSNLQAAVQGSLLRVTTSSPTQKRPHYWNDNTHHPQHTPHPPQLSGKHPLGCTRRVKLGIGAVTGSCSCRYLTANLVLFIENSCSCRACFKRPLLTLRAAWADSNSTAPLPLELNSKRLKRIAPTTRDHCAAATTTSTVACEGLPPGHPLLTCITSRI